MYLLKLIIVALLFSVSLGYGEKYPPIPKDKTRLPAPIAKEIKAIASLCKLKTYEAKVARLEKSINRLQKYVPYYYEKGSASYVISMGLSAMSFLYDDPSMQYSWRRIFGDAKVARAYVLGNYLSSRAAGSRMPSAAKQVDTAIDWFFYDWEHDVYRGFYCFDFGYPPPPYKRVNRDSCC